MNFSDCFYNSNNEIGFIETFNRIESDKLTQLIGAYNINDLKRYDRYIKSKIGLQIVSPLLYDIFNDDSISLVEKQEETIKTFIMLRYSDLLKIKDILLTEISVDNGKVIIEDKNSDTTSTNKISSFNSETLQNDNENSYSNETDNTITEKRTDTEGIIRNIKMLSDFYRQNILDKIIEFIRELFTLQVLD